jgi:hypothetical protein
MSAKQDRVAPRTAEDIERKTNFKQTFAEFAGMVEEAKEAADSASKAASDAVNNLDRELDQEEIFNRLTNNGEVQGIYRAEDGQIYINASYIVSGVIDAALVTVKNLIADSITSGVLKSSDGTLSIDLDSAALTIKNSINNSIKFLHGSMYLNHSGTDVMNIYSTLWATTGKVAATVASMNGADLELVALTTSGVAAGAVSVGGTSNTVKIKGKTVTWLDKGNGVYELVGAD